MDSSDYNAMVTTSLLNEINIECDVAWDRSLAFEYITQRMSQMDHASDKKTAKSMRNKSLMYRLILINITSSDNIHDTSSLVKRVHALLDQHLKMNKTTALTKPLICALVG